MTASSFSARELVRTNLSKVSSQNREGDKDARDSPNLFRDFVVIVRLGRETIVGKVAVAGIDVVVDEILFEIGIVGGGLFGLRG